MKSRDHGFEILTVVVAIIFIAFYFLYQGQEKRRCENRGGRVVEMRSTDTGSWFCQERP